MPGSRPGSPATAGCRSTPRRDASCPRARRRPRRRSTARRRRRPRRAAELPAAAAAVAARRACATCSRAAPPPARGPGRAWWDARPALALAAVVALLAALLLAQARAAASSRFRAILRAGRAQRVRAFAADQGLELATCPDAARVRAPRSRGASACEPAAFGRALERSAYAAPGRAGRRRAGGRDDRARCAPCAARSGPRRRLRGVFSLAASAQRRARSRAMTMRCTSVVPSTTCSILACARKRASGYSLQQAVGAQHLAARDRGAQRRVGTEALGVRGQHAAATLVERGGRGAIEQAPGDDVGLDVGERELDRLQVEQRAAERLASACVVERDRERLGGQSDRDRGDVHARDVDRAERRAHALARGRQQRVGRDVHLVVGDLADRQERARGLVVQPLDADAVGARVDRQHEHVARAALGARPADEHEHVGLARERDPGLAPGHAPAVVHGAPPAS